MFEDMFLKGSHNKDDELLKVSPLHFIPGDEPIKFVASQTIKLGYIKSKQGSIQSKDLKESYVGVQSTTRD